jgi:hypothetical protein
MSLSAKAPKSNATQARNGSVGKTGGPFERVNVNLAIDHSLINHFAFPNFIAPMSTEQTHRRIPNPRFRVLVIGRANAGKTTILQRVCDTTESPTIYRRGKDGRREKVRGPNFVCESDLTADQVKLDPSTGVSDSYFLLVCPLTWYQRGEHVIDDELVFSNHTGYVFHDSRGIESGGTEELETLKEFIRRKCGEKRLHDKLHAIWFVLSSSCWQQLTVMVSGTASQWMAIDQGSI